MSHLFRTTTREYVSKAKPMTDDVQTAIEEFEKIVDGHNGHPNLVTTSDVERARKALYDFITDGISEAVSERDQLWHDRAAVMKSLAASREYAEPFVALARYIAGPEWDNGVARKMADAALVHLSIPSTSAAKETT